MPPEVKLFRGMKLPEKTLPCEVRGIVVHGDKRGRLLGFPTANLANSIPKDLPFGVYASETEITARGTKVYRSVSSVGVRPTFGGSEARLETFILDFAEDIYGMEIVVRLSEFVRAEQKFESVTDLITTMKQDVSRVMAL